MTLVAFAVDDDGTLIWLNDRSAQDRDVPIVVSGDPIGHTCSQNPSPVETIQLAPTILQLLGLDPNSLQAVQIEHTQALPSG